MFNSIRCDAPANLLKYSNASPKVKTTYKEQIGAHSLIRTTFGIRKVCWNFGIKIKMNNKCVDYSYQSAQN
jgi:hypothetical protein